MIRTVWRIVAAHARQRIAETTGIVLSPSEYMAYMTYHGLMSGLHIGGIRVDLPPTTLCGKLGAALRYHRNQRKP